MPGKRSHLNFSTTSSIWSSSSFFIGPLLIRRSRPRIQCFLRRNQLVVQGQVRFSEADCVDLGISESEGRRRCGETFLMTKDVLDVLSTNVTGLQNLMHRVACVDLAKDLDEENETNDLAMDRLTVCSEQLEVITADIAE